ncbi:MAG: hypothetical protein RIG84_15725, partial [Roseovarius sp.]
MKIPAGLLLTGMACASAMLSAGVPVSAQDAGGQFGPSVLPVGQAAVGQQIARITVEIVTSSGDRARDAAALQSAREITAGLVGRDYLPLLLDQSLSRLVSEGTVRAARHRTSIEDGGGRLGVVVSLDVAAAPQETAVRAPAAPPAFPVIHEDERSKLTFILGGGVGLYSDTNAWFGAPGLFNAFSPIAGRLPGRQTAWSEGYLEFGLGGATRLGESDLYLFGAASGIYSLSFGQDIFRDDTRDFLHPGKGYVGLLYADPESGDTA